MEKIILFFKFIAWAVALVSTIFTFLSIWGTLTYPGSVDETLDKLKGLRTEYPILRWFIPAVISWAFIFAF
jgi:hypothetical protein